MPEPITARNFVKKSDGTVVFDSIAGVGDTLVNFSQSPSKTSTRLVDDGSSVLALFESNGFTWTKNNLFCGTAAECDAEIASKKLKPLPENGTGIGTTGGKAITI